MADDMTREEMLGTLHGTRHERCIPSHAVTNPVPMPSTSNYQRDMAIGVDKSEFLKIVMRKEEDSRFSTLIKLKKPSVLQRAGATTARELYDSHLRAKSKSTPTLGTARSIRGPTPLPPGHFLAGTNKSSSAHKFPPLTPVRDPEALKRLRAQQKRRRRREQKQRQFSASAMSHKQLRRSGRASSVATHSTYGSLASYGTHASGLSNVSYRFGGKGKVGSNTFTTTGFPSQQQWASEKVEGVPDGDVTEDMVKSFGVSLKDSWSKARTISHMQAVKELQDDEQAKKEMALLEERREVLMDELAATNEQLHDKEVEELVSQLRKPQLEAVDPWATDDVGAATPVHGGHDNVDQDDAAAATSRAQPMSSPIRVLLSSARTTSRDDEQEVPVQLSMVPPFLGQRYEKGLKSTNKAANAIPFVAPETSRIVAGRWRKKNESLAEAEYGYYSPAGQTPFYMKGLGERLDEVANIPRFMSKLHEQEHIALWPLFKPDNQR